MIAISPIISFRREDRIRWREIVCKINSISTKFLREAKLLESGGEEPMEVLQIR
jgi:hypothetical protein